MGPNLEVLRIDARKFARIALISQALIDKLQIIEWYNHRTKRIVCCLRMTALRPVIVVLSAFILRHHTAAVSSYDSTFDDLELVHKSLRTIEHWGPHT